MTITMTLYQICTELIRYILLHLRSLEYYSKKYARLPLPDVSHEVVVSFTTIPDRIHRIAPMIKSLLDEMSAFVQQVYLPDVCAIGALYADWLPYGAGVKNYLDRAIEEPQPAIRCLEQKNAAVGGELLLVERDHSFARAGSRNRT